MTLSPADLTPQQLLEKGVNQNNAAMVREALERGAHPIPDPVEGESIGVYPLAYAVRWGKDKAVKEICAYLRSLPADPHAIASALQTNFSISDGNGRGTVLDAALFNYYRHDGIIRDMAGLYHHFGQQEMLYPAIGKLLDFSVSGDEADRREAFRNALQHLLAHLPPGPLVPAAEVNDIRPYCQYAFRLTDARLMEVLMRHGVDYYGKGGGRKKHGAGLDKPNFIGLSNGKKAKQIKWLHAEQAT